MSIEKAVEDKVAQILAEGKYCTEESARKVAAVAVKELDDHINKELTEQFHQNEKTSDRLDRLWDHVHSPPILRFLRLRKILRRLKFWSR